MYRGYGIGEPAHPAAAARAARVLWHEGADRNDAAGRRVAITVVELDAVGEPGIVDHEAAIQRVPGEKDEVLIAAQPDFCHHRPTRVELAVDGVQVGTDPARECHAPARIGRDRGPE